MTPNGILPHSQVSALVSHPWTSLLLSTQNQMQGPQPDMCRVKILGALSSDGVSTSHPSPRAQETPRKRKWKGARGDRDTRRTRPFGSAKQGSQELTETEGEITAYQGPLSYFTGSSKKCLRGKPEDLPWTRIFFLVEPVLS